MLRKCALRRSSGKEGYPMLKFHSEQGEISVSSAVFSNITGMAATNCFGVKGNVIYNEDESISIELHIIVENGVNIPAVCRSIMNEVRYVVNKNTGAEVRAVDVFVDSMIL